MNNPQAFPCYKGDIMPQEGMTLIDYFAAKAMQSLMPKYWDRRYITGDKTGHLGLEGLVMDAYDAAEAMLKEREKRMK